MRKRVVFLFVLVLLTSAAALYTLHSITPLPLRTPAVENGSVALRLREYGQSGETHRP